jgi:hypothetical protein
MSQEDWDDEVMRTYIEMEVERIEAIPESERTKDDHLRLVVLTSDRSILDPPPSV